MMYYNERTFSMLSLKVEDIESEAEVDDEDDNGTATSCVDGVTSEKDIIAKLNQYLATAERWNMITL